MARILRAQSLMTATAIVLMCFILCLLTARLSAHELSCPVPTDSDSDEVFAGTSVVITVPKFNGGMYHGTSLKNAHKRSPPPKLSDEDHKSGPICGSDGRLYRSRGHLAHENWLRGTNVVRAPMCKCFPSESMPPLTPLARSIDD